MVLIRTAEIGSNQKSFGCNVILSAVECATSPPPVNGYPFDPSRLGVTGYIQGDGCGEKTQLINTNLVNMVRKHLFKGVQCLFVPCIYQIHFSF